MRLVIFDVDGTLTQTTELDTACFVSALSEVFEIGEVDTDWAGYPETTDSAILVEAVRRTLHRAPSVSELLRMQERFLTLLGDAIGAAADGCMPVAGGHDTFSTLLDDPAYAVAIATGGWREPAYLKLRTAGYVVDDVPFASASDASSRTDILSVAVDRARMHHRRSAFDSIVYVGDGVWDARAARAFGCEFVGVGRGRGADLLKREGARAVVRDLTKLDHVLDARPAPVLSRRTRQSAYAKRMARRRQRS